MCTCGPGWCQAQETDTCISQTQSWVQETQKGECNQCNVTKPPTGGVQSGGHPGELLILLRGWKRPDWGAGTREGFLAAGGAGDTGSRGNREQGERGAGQLGSRDVGKETRPVTAQYDGLEGPDSIMQPVLHINTQNFLFKHQGRTHLVFQARIPFSELPSVCPKPTQKLRVDSALTGTGSSLGPGRAFGRQPPPSPSIQNHWGGREEGKERNNTPQAEKTSL